jgi:drug/metabolite transporter superfamily protein YnfA
MTVAATDGLHVLIAPAGIIGCYLSWLCLRKNAPM